MSSERGDRNNDYSPSVASNIRPDRGTENYAEEYSTFVIEITEQTDKCETKERKWSKRKSKATQTTEAQMVEKSVQCEIEYFSYIPLLDLEDESWSVEPSELDEVSCLSEDESNNEHGTVLDIVSVDETSSRGILPKEQLLEKREESQLVANSSMEDLREMLESHELDFTSCRSMERWNSSLEFYKRKKWRKEKRDEIFMANRVASCKRSTPVKSVRMTRSRGKVSPLPNVQKDVLEYKRRIVEKKVL